MPANVSFVASLMQLPSAAPSAPPASGSGNGFAQMLRQQRAEAERPAAKPPEKAPQKEPVKAREKERSAEQERTSDAKSSDKAAVEKAAAEKKAADKADRAQRKADPSDQADARTDGAEAADETTDTREAGTKGRTAAADDKDTPPAEAGLTDFLAGLNLPRAPEAEAAEGAAGKSTAGSALALGAEKGGAKTASLQAQAAEPAHTGAADEAAEAATRPDFAGRLAQETRGATGAAEGAALKIEGLHGAGGTHGAAGAGTSTSAASAAATAQATVATPTDSPDFPQALGVQVSVLAKQGVQQAELQLNPVEMGPIVVQIALDGSKAQVDFASASAQTRQLLENGLPGLAASLRDAGLTLSGGGVFQQPRQPRQNDGEAQGPSDGRGSRRIDGVGAADTASAPMRTVRVSASGVDLYA